MHQLRKVAAVITFPARTTVGAARLGMRTAGHLLGWAAEQVVGKAPDRSSAAHVTVPDAPVSTGVATPDEDVDPMAPTRTAPAPAPAAAPARKVPASEVPLTSAPTPSLPAALESFDELDDVSEPVPTPVTKKAAAKKAPARKAPSKQAAVLAPALGLSEDEVAAIASDIDQG